MTRRDPLSAIPVAASATSLEPLPNGGAVLTCLAGERAGIGGWLARTLGFRPLRRFELDELGLCFWAQIDGERRLSEIRETLCRRYAFSPAEAERAIVEFTAALLRRNLLALRVEEP